MKFYIFSRFFTLMNEEDVVDADGVDSLLPVLP